MVIKRTSIVNEAKILTVTGASIAFVGDNALMNLRNKAIAVRRDIPTFSDEEGDFRDYPIFRYIMLPPPDPPVPVVMTQIHENPEIKVGRIKVSSFSNSSVFQAGSNEVLRADSRIKHFRQLAEMSLPRPVPRRIPTVRTP